jgi:hypothetical protein
MQNISQCCGGARWVYTRRRFRSQQEIKVQVSLVPRYQRLVRASHYARTKLNYFTFHQVSRFDYLRRHLRKTLPYLTLRKLVNLALNMAE